jgi:prepilin-type N-terminal cleavage/methylation domain-containing protein
MSKNKGFTLIELLVVIAIIGVLGAVVLGALNSARNKGNASAVKSELNQARLQADLFFDGDYTDVCDPLNDNADPKGINYMVKKAGEANNFKSTDVNVNGAGDPYASVRCNVSDDGVFWAAQVQMRNEDGTLTNADNPNPTYWCVDSARRGGISNTDLGTNTACTIVE